MVNRVILIGNLGGDPEVRRLENGSVVAKFSIATNEFYKDKSGEFKQLTEWHDIVAWRGLAERAESQLKKGIRIYLEGRLTHRKWQDKDGNNRYTTEVVANVIKILDRKEMQEEGETHQVTTSPPPSPPVYKENNAGDQADDDLPF